MRTPMVSPFTMTKLSVNVNKVALLRNSRGKNMPDVLKVSYDLLKMGAHGITVHPRPDERHAKLSDLKPLNKLVRGFNKQVEFNVEGYPSDDFLTMLEDVRPHQATFVPDPPEALTSNAGWKLSENIAQLQSICARVKAAGIRVSLFVDPFDFTDRDMDALELIVPDRIELYTEKYADHFGKPDQMKVTEAYRIAADRALDCEVDLNAGHDLNLQNLGFLIDQIPEIQEVSIGHAFICEALYMGYDKVMKGYLDILGSRR